jgi:hypothetical protein
MESLEEKRKKVVNFCKCAFKPKYVEDMKRKFAPVVAEWDEETLDEWIRRRECRRANFSGNRGDNGRRRED